MTSLLKSLTRFSKDSLVPKKAHANVGVRISENKIIIKIKNRVFIMRLLCFDWLKNIKFTYLVLIAMFSFS